MTRRCRHQDLRLLDLVPGQVAYYVTPGGWVPVNVGRTKTILVETMRDAACQDCPLAAYSHILRAIPGQRGAYEKLCSIPFLRAGKLTLESLMQYRGCGAKDDDYTKARRLIERDKKAA